MSPCPEERRWILSCSCLPLVIGFLCSSPAELVQCPNFATSILTLRPAPLRRTYNGNRIAVRFEYEFHDESGQWFRAHGNEVCLGRACSMAAAAAVHVHAGSPVI